MGHISRFSRTFLYITPEETSFEKRGFLPNNADVKTRLEKVGITFLCGYHLALEKDRNLNDLEAGLNLVNPELRGFAFEGAAMGLALLDFLSPLRRERIQYFIRGAGSKHVYMVHIGYGWLLAQLPWISQRSLKQLNPLLKWLAIDGYGFCKGYFHWPRYFYKQTVPRTLSGYDCRAFDQGLGRSLWFVKGANIHEISSTIATFSAARHADLWSGIGLACAYAGGVNHSTLETLRDVASLYRPQLAQGAAFAAKARHRAGNLADHTELACKILCGLSSTAAAEVTDIALEQLPEDGDEPAYEIWRHRIQARFLQQEIKV